MSAEVPISELTSKQRAHLRSLAHPLKPVVHVGSDGVSEALVRTVDEAFANRELIKVKVQQGAPADMDETADAIVRELPDVQVAQTIGRTIVLYRPFEEDPEIELPDGGSRPPTRGP